MTVQLAFFCHFYSEFAFQPRRSEDKMPDVKIHEDLGTIRNLSVRNLKGTVHAKMKSHLLTLISFQTFLFFCGTQRLY